MKRTATIVVAAASLSLGGVAFSAPDAQAWLAAGSHVQYPSSGGKWTYGFWNAKVRSHYYHGSRCHGSTVIYNGNSSRSANTAAGRTAVAEKWAYNAAWNDDSYYYRTC